MPKNREKQRARKKEDRLKTRSECDYKDPTPYEAINNIRRERAV
jgi:hypothetical protein